MTIIIQPNVRGFRWLEIFLTFRRPDQEVEEEQKKKKEKKSISDKKSRARAEAGAFCFE